MTSRWARAVTPISSTREPRPFQHASAHHGATEHEGASAIPACKCSPRRNRIALPRYADLEHEIESWVREQRMRPWVRQHQRLERQYWERQQRNLSFTRLLVAPPRRPLASVTATADVDVEAAIRLAGAEAMAARDATAAAADRAEVALQRAALAATSGDTAGAPPGSPGGVADCH